jgi:hypothetical protein
VDHSEVKAPSESRSHASRDGRREPLAPQGRCAHGTQRVLAGWPLHRGWVLRVTAIDSSEENKERRDHAIKRVCKNLGLSEDDFGAIATWNDQRERTKNEVVAKLRAVALGL